MERTRLLGVATRVLLAGTLLVFAGCSRNTHKGRPTITVTAEWHARFVAPGIDRALPARMAVDTYDLDVREYRAVRVAPGD